MSCRIAVIGQGIIGLTCAIRLLEKGYSIEVFSKEPFADTTSMAAGAFWWPHRAYPEKRVSKWAKETYDEYGNIQSIPETGIHFEKHLRFCLDPDESAYARHLVDDWKEIDGAKYGIDCHEAFQVTLPVIDVPVYMSYLKVSLARDGARFTHREIKSPAELFPDFDLVVNCSGVWARYLVNDKEVFPIRGHAVRVSRPKDLTASTRLYQKNDKFTLILPRSRDVILGGTAEEEDWDRTPHTRDTEAIFKRCSELVPEIKNSEILGSAVGLRPGRKEVRLELERSEKNPTNQ